jgi:hypothetical protein
MESTRPVPPASNRRVWHYVAFAVLGAVITAVGVITTIRHVADFGKETLVLPPGVVSSGSIRSSGPGSKFRFWIHPRGGRVRFYFGAIEWGSRMNEAILAEFEATSQVLEGDVTIRLERSVPSRSCFWAFKNEGSSEVAVDFKWD